ncbi:MAG: AI-2E family transporter [Limisphaerales bacterium]
MIWFAVTALAVSLTLVIVGAVAWGFGKFLQLLSPVLWPLAVAAVIAMILDPVVDWLMTHRVPRLRAILLVFGVGGVLVLAILGSVVPRLVVEARDLAGRIPGYAATAQTKIQKWINEPPASLLPLIPKSILDRMPGHLTTQSVHQASQDVNPPVRPGAPHPSRDGGKGGPARGAGTNASASDATAVAVASVERDDPTGSGTTGEGAAGGDTVPTEVAEAGAQGAEAPWWAKAVNPEALKTAGDWLAAVLPEVGGWFVGQLGRVASWFGVVVGLALIPIYAFYFLLEKRGIETTWTDYLPVSDSRLKDELVWLLKNINDALIVFFRGQVLVAICDGILYAMGFLLIGLPYALLLGLAAAVLTIVPFLGAIVTCGAALVIAMVQFGDWQHPLWVLVVFSIVQGIEGWVIQPKIIGDRVGLHPLTIIIALLVGTTLMGGILGGILAIPATAVIRALMFRYVWRTRGARVSGEGVSEPGPLDDGAKCSDETS